MTIYSAWWTAAAQAATVFGSVSPGAGQLRVKQKKTQRLLKNSPPGADCVESRNVDAAAFGERAHAKRYRDEPDHIPDGQDLQELFHGLLMLEELP